MTAINNCPSIYQGTFSNPFLAEKIILTMYSLIFVIGLVGNIMTIIIIKYNTYLRTPTNFYLLNLAVSDLMILMCNLPLEMLEIYNRTWPLSIVFCKLRNISAEFFTCSSILTILAFTCERYFAIVHPVHLHRLSHFRRAQSITIIILIISLGFSVPLGLSYEIKIDPSIVSSHPTTLSLPNNHTKFIETNYKEKSSFSGCKSCVPKQSVENILSVIIIITSICFFYFPMIIIGAIYLFIGRALRRVSKYEGYSNSIEISVSSPTSFSNKDVTKMQQQQSSHINSYSWLKMRARCQARRVVVKTLVAVVCAFFICYAPLYFQRLLLAITTLKSHVHSEFALFSNFMAYLYVISGVTYFFGSVINPILYNVVSNKYRRAFRDLVCCRLMARRKLKKTNTQKLLQINRSQKQTISYFVRQPQFLDINQCNHIRLCLQTSSNNTTQQIPLNISKNPMTNHSYISQSNSSSTSSRHKNKCISLYQ